jgi:hypothetical protein
MLARFLAGFLMVAALGVGQQKPGFAVFERQRKSRHELETQTLQGENRVGNNCSV